MANQNKSFWRGFSDSLLLMIKGMFTKEKVIAFLKGSAVKFAIKKILGAALTGGFKVWLIKFIVTELFEEIAEPLIKLSFRKVGYYYHVKEGAHVLEKIEDAESRDDWRDSLRDT